MPDQSDSAREYRRAGNDGTETGGFEERETGNPHPWDSRQQSNRTAAKSLSVAAIRAPGTEN
jgi:hypothetical protein